MHAIEPRSTSKVCLSRLLARPVRLGLVGALGLVVLASCGASGGNPPSGGSGSASGTGGGSGSNASSGGGSSSGSSPGSGSNGGGSGSSPGSGSNGGGSGSSPGSGSTSGAPSSGSGGGDAGPVAQATDFSCGAITVAAADVISDFQTANPLMYPVAGRGGTAWYSYGAEDTTTSVGASTPGAGTNAFSVDSTVAGPCGKNGALKVSSQGNTSYGVGFGVNMMPDKPIGTKQTYDATTAGYTGIGFWMKCSSETQFVYFKVPDAANDAQVASPQCSYTGTNPARVCNQYGIKNVAVLPTWTHYQVYFSEALQDWKSNPNSFSAGLDPTKLTAFQIQVNSTYTVNQSNGSAGNASPNAFTCWVDDVHFLKAAAPKTPAPAGGYTVSGKNIVGPSGPVRLRGLGRPSFEWDPAGFGITREDLMRIKAWGKNVNVVRFSLNQGMWLTGHGAYNPLYAAYVDRAVQWALQQGLAVILDLHWNEGSGNMAAMAGTYGQQPMADTYSVTFWAQVAAKYKNDPRVIFELYNEPHDIPVATWQNGDGNWAGMQQLYNAVRTTAGASNLVLLGGLDWAYDLSAVVGKVTGTNIAYVTHPYVFKNSTSNQNAFITPSATVPVVATEFGDATTTVHATGCSPGTYTSQLATFAANNISYTGYAWYEANCGYPSLITDYSGTPSSIGAPVQADLNQ